MAIPNNDSQLNEEKLVLSFSSVRRLTREDRERLDELLCATLQREMPEVKYPMASSSVLRKALWSEVESYLARLIGGLVEIDGQKLSKEEARELARSFTGEGWR